MSFLRGIVKETNKANMGLGWTTPAGLPVMQCALDIRSTRVATKLLGSVNLRFAEGFEDSLHKSKQSSSVAPNFVHSMDAAHLMLTVVSFERDFGATAWAMVHASRRVARKRRVGGRRRRRPPLRAPAGVLQPH